MLTAGGQDQRVTFMRKTRATDTQGGGAVTAAAIAGLSNIPARVEPLDQDGHEARQADQVTAVQRWRVVVRHGAAMATVTAADWLTWSGRTVHIESIRPGGHRFREWVEVRGVERAS